MILDSMYGAGVDGLCGNDDAGQMSAWYVFGALGFYPVCPGSRNFELGSPLVKSASLHLEHGKTVHIETRNQSPENVYVQRVEVNGKTIHRHYLDFEELRMGGKITFFMGPVEAK
jgi:putative alpha-1,2-mannosidase